MEEIVTEMTRLDLCDKDQHGKGHSQDPWMSAMAASHPTPQTTNSKGNRGPGVLLTQPLLLVLRDSESLQRWHRKGHTCKVFLSPAADLDRLFPDLF